MPEREYPSEYRAMWLFALFDLPVDTCLRRRDYAHFRRSLLKAGFTMLQYSVYARYCANEQMAQSHVLRQLPALPPHGQVRFIMVTEKQFEKMQVFFGRKPRAAEPAPPQLMLF